MYSFLLPEDFPELLESDGKQNPVPGVFCGLDQGGVEEPLLNHHTSNALVPLPSVVVESKVERVGTVAVGQTHLNIHR